MFEAYYSQLNTPCLVVDEPMTRENIKRMQQVADANGCTLRPHIKTHKTPYFAKLQQQLGARGITSCQGVRGRAHGRRGRATFSSPTRWWARKSCAARARWHSAWTG